MIRKLSLFVVLLLGASSLVHAIPPSGPDFYTTDQCSNVVVKPFEFYRYFKFLTVGRVRYIAYQLNITNNHPSDQLDHIYVDLTGLPGGFRIQYPRFTDYWYLFLRNQFETGELGVTGVTFEFNTSPEHGPLPSETWTNAGFIFESFPNVNYDIKAKVLNCTYYRPSTSSSSTGLPSSSSTTSSPSSGDCSSIAIMQSVVNTWQGGSQWTVTLSNTGSRVVSALDVLASSPSSISQLWSMTDAGNGHYTLPSYTNAIAVGGTIQFGYISKSAIQVPFSLSSVSCR
eukprot:TRINITY_DN501_c0_g1_i1.p1 TRINITY_DN501_c0_g1~~TRINITY_DN501_c0_g1_i1.p1  ORF type:complete len:312 (-),score=74.30 TRINITY_DN501_c0_g1_i1:133-987(-)